MVYVTATMLRKCRVGDVVKCTDPKTTVPLAVKYCSSGTGIYEWDVPIGMHSILDSAGLAKALEKARPGSIFIQHFEQTESVNV